MDKLLKYSLLACCILLAVMLLNAQSGPFIHLIVAPALGLVGSSVLILLALASLRRDSREGSDA